MYDHMFCNISFMVKNNSHLIFKFFSAYYNCSCSPVCKTIIKNI